MKRTHTHTNIPGHLTFPLTPELKAGLCRRLHATRVLHSAGELAPMLGKMEMVFKSNNLYVRIIRQE